ncbi:MAG: hypothetical protein ACOYMI_08280 [Phycisphaerales bacterium]
MSDRAYRLMEELWTHAGTGSHNGRLRCWVTEDGSTVFRVWPRVEPKQDDPVAKQAKALTRRMNCSRRKIDLCFEELTSLGLIKRHRRSGGKPGERTGLNMQAETHLIVPSNRFVSACKNGNGRATLLTACDLMASHTKRMVSRMADQMHADVIAVIRQMAGVTVGLYRPLADSDNRSQATLLTADTGKTNAQDQGNECARSCATNPQDVAHPIQPFHYNPSNKTNQPNPTASPETDGIDRPDWVGLDCCAGETEQASDPAEPTCPVEVKPSQPTEAAEPEPDCPVEGEAERQMAALQFTADERKVIEEAFRDPVRWDAIAASGRSIRAGVEQVQRSTTASDRYGLRMGDIWNLLVSDDWTLPDAATSGQRLASMQCILREFMYPDWRALEERRRENDGEISLEEIEQQERERQQEAARENRIQEWAEQLRELGVTERVARSLAEQHERNPDVIRRAIEDTKRMMKAGVGRNAACLLVSKLNNATKNKATTKRSEPSQGYSWAQ